MQFEPRSPPATYGQHSGAFSYNPYSNTIPISLPYDLNRLYNEKKILSKGLADCVTYLKAMREKHVKCVYQLNAQSPLPQKKRKRLQQTKRHLDIEIKNRQLAEQAYLNNLQACETNIYLANMKAYELSCASFHASSSTATSTFHTPTLYSNSGSEATGLTWEGWTDEAVISPFQKQSSSPFFCDDLAPDACAEDHRRDSAVAKDTKRPPPLCPDAIELSNSLPVPPNTAHSQYRRVSFLSPAAPVFKPTYSDVLQKSSCLQLNLKKLSMSSSAAATTVELLQKQRFSDAEIVPIIERFNIVAQTPPHYLSAHHAFAHAASQETPQKKTRPPIDRQRSNSL